QRLAGPVQGDEPAGQCGRLPARQPAAAGRVQQGGHGQQDGQVGGGQEPGVGRRVIRQTAGGVFQADADPAPAPDAVLVRQGARDAQGARPAGPPDVVVKRVGVPSEAGGGQQQRRTGAGDGQEGEAVGPPPGGRRRGSGSGGGHAALRRRPGAGGGRPVIPAAGRVSSRVIV